jgi:cytochrome c
MKPSLILAASALALTFSAGAQADQALAQAKNCMACHAVDKKLVGPSYKDIAKKYAGQKDAVANLATKIIKGGAGAWGAVPMPANPQVSQAEAQRLVTWIMAQR